MLELHVISERHDGPSRRLLFLTAVETARRDGCQQQQPLRWPVVTDRLDGPSRRLVRTGLKSAGVNRR